MERIARALREARTAAGLTQQQVADALGVGTSYVSDVEHARRNFAERFIPKLPPAMRRPVAEAVATEHDAASAQLRSIA